MTGASGLSILIATSDALDSRYRSFAISRLLGVAGVGFIMGIPGSDDIMPNYQTTSFHDALHARKVLNLRPAPEFEAWLEVAGLVERGETLRLGPALPSAFERAVGTVG